MPGRHPQRRGPCSLSLCAMQVVYIWPQSPSWPSDHLGPGHHRAREASSLSHSALSLRIIPAVMPSAGRWTLVLVPLQLPYPRQLAGLPEQRGNLGHGLQLQAQEAPEFQRADSGLTCGVGVVSASVPWSTGGFSVCTRSYSTSPRSAVQRGGGPAGSPCRQSGALLAGKTCPGGAGTRV